ncbi:MAG: nuclear transport factor 2 family protein [Pseudobdellovibrio sp.]
MLNNQSFMQEIIGLERKFWNAMKDHDLDAAVALTDFPCIVAGSQGTMSVDRKKFEEMFNANKEAIRTFDFEEAKAEVRLLGPDTAVIAYPVHSTLMSAGQNKSINAVDTSTWIRRHNKWLCAMHTETEMAPGVH